ncbi:hypothetical protein AAFF_G00203990 [Aldrovandia affinis]|uniref:Uncharacterized protein n=1 Tax=Aldrovandia affinis TaxID=143900 RepID=A0AAD7SY24_9TELE|nr:hypothetical protein AAFF_G00203990 [Aldrovandia affinis]
MPASHLATRTITQAPAVALPAATSDARIMYVTDMMYDIVPPVTSVMHREVTGLQLHAQTAAGLAISTAISALKHRFRAPVSTGLDYYVAHRNQKASDTVLISPSSGTEESTFEEAH